MTETTTIIRGNALTIAALASGKKCPVRAFIEELQESDQKKVIQLLRRAADYGLLKNEEKFRKLKSYELWEFKSFQVRLMCFMDGDKLVILTHGFIKKQDKTPRTEIEKAVRLKMEYLKGRSRK
jgi:phage-related protein